MSNRPLSVEADAGSFSALGRPPERAWLVRLCRDDRSVVVAIGLTQTAAQHLASRIADVVLPDPIEAPKRSANEVEPITSPLHTNNAHTS